MHHRTLSVLATTLAALALGAAPALAGEDDDGDDDDSPTQVQQAPVPAAGGGGGGGGVVPRGGVQTGLGGTAPSEHDGLLLGLASGALVLVAAGGGIAAARR